MSAAPSSGLAAPGLAAPSSGLAAPGLAAPSSGLAAPGLAAPGPAPRPRGGPLRSLRLLLRAGWILAVLFGALVAHGVRHAVSPSRWRRAREAREHDRGVAFARTLERLGATFIKFGQILSTRPDLLPPGYIAGLRRLQDAVAPEAPAAVARVLAAELPADAFASFDPQPVASASIAQVHRATLADGRRVAVKIQRPGVAARIEGDVAILRVFARLLHLLPSFRPLLLPSAIGDFGHALEGQLDFRREAANNLRFAENFRDLPRVSVPSLVPELCTGRVLTMAFIDGVKAEDAQQICGDRRALARLGADAILRMVFVDGFVHADLHPGNLLFTREGELVLLDLGLVAEIAPELMRPWLETFFALGSKNGAEVARLLYVHAPHVGVVDYRRYRDECVAWFKRFEGKPLGEIETSVVVTGVMNILRRHRVRVDPRFTTVHVALLVAEGLGKQLDPDLDIIGLSLPVLMRSLGRATAGIPPKREAPRLAD
jgi:ubiquinone biosynthesis protein